MNLVSHNAQYVLVIKIPVHFLKAYLTVTEMFLHSFGITEMMVVLNLM